MGQSCVPGGGGGARRREMFEKGLEVGRRGSQEDAQGSNPTRRR